MNSRLRLPLPGLLTTLAAAAVVASACGPSQPPASQPPASQPLASQATQQTAPAPTSEAHPAEQSEHHEHHALTQSTPVRASQLLAQVQALGIDMQNPKTLADIDLAKKKKMMPLFQKALGFSDCTGCHAKGDFKANTKNVQMARNMWDHFVKDLRDEQGGPLFCDSCHSGNEHVLKRDDKDALNAFMESDYEHKLSRADGEENSCSTCHTDVFEKEIFKKVWGITP